MFRPLLQILLAALFALALSAQAAADPPGRVGRIAWMSGTVQLRNSDTGEWNTAVLNWPLTNGDALSTGPGARLEIGIGSTIVRLDSSSELSIDQIDDQRVRLFLVSGSASVRLRSRESAREFELATRDGSFTTQDVGAFRFDHENNVSSATPYLGTLHFEAEDSELEIPNGQRAQFWYAGRTAYSLSSPPRDDFSEWSVARDRRLDTRDTRRYVSQEMTGYEDLAGHGDWYDSVDYGPVWYPSVVAAGWAPYRAGHWAWVAPWGWTWIDDAPWGFAPFHYGRWVWHRDRWGWAPGRIVARPVYAPALVAWVGTPKLSIGISSAPTVGWFPLAPREVYVPSYRCSPTYVRQVNITHVTRIDNVTQIINEPNRVMERTKFVNRRLPQAVTIVPAEVVTQRRPVGPAVERNRNPRFLETINRQAPLAQAPVAAPPLPPRVDPDRRERDRREREGRGANSRERRPDSDRQPGDRRGTPAAAAPLPAPLNAAPAVTPQPPAPQSPRGEPPRRPEGPPNANPRFNRGQPPAAPEAAVQSNPPTAGPALPPRFDPDRRPQAAGDRQPGDRRGTPPPAAPQPAPLNATPMPAPAVTPQAPAPQPPRGEPPRRPDAPSDTNPRFNRGQPPATPDAAAQPKPATTAPALPPRFDPGRRERDRNSDNARERRPDSDRQPGERRGALPAPAPQPAPLNVAPAPAAVPQAPAPQPPRSERPRRPDTPADANPRASTARARRQQARLHQCQRSAARSNVSCRQRGRLRATRPCLPRRRRSRRFSAASRCRHAKPDRNGPNSRAIRATMPRKECRDRRRKATSSRRTTRAEDSTASATAAESAPRISAQRSSAGRAQPPSCRMPLSRRPRSRSRRS
ncbi:MAG: hypothetical protein IPI02_06750 [Sterolibacteriaceae bacterium]|nr:hypothetical protein [Sterolibacteriaceae bacterium]